jgi:ribonuclease HI
VKMLETLILEQRDNGTARTLPSGALLCSTRCPTLVRLLRLDELATIDGAVGRLVVSDGSGTRTTEGAKAAGGFGALSITETTVTVIIGGHPLTTSGAMELAGAAEGLTDAVADGPDGQILAISDYLAWVQGKLGVYEANDFRGLKNPDTWRYLVNTVRRWGELPIGRDDVGRILHREHVESHV